MDSRDDFKAAMHDIYNFSPLIGLEDQELLQGWVKRLAAAAAGAGSGKDQDHALDYARFLAYQLQRKQLRFPFSRPPAKESLPDLKEVLFGAESVAATDALNTSFQLTNFNKSARDRSRSHRDRTLNDSGVAPRRTRTRASPSPGNSLWDSHCRAAGESSLWDSHVGNPRGARDVMVHLEELPEDAALWLLLTRLCPHTLDAGALMHAVVAEELAEWSARLAAEQTLANQHEDQDDQGEEAEWAWAAKADHRADYWHEVMEDAKQKLKAADPKAADQLTAKVDFWLRQQSRQLQAEHAQLNALTEELQEMKRQVEQSQKWRESQFEMQNRVLQTEVAALRQSISSYSKKMDNLNSTDKYVAKKRSSISHDSLNTSNNGNQ